MRPRTKLCTPGVENSEVVVQEKGIQKCIPQEPFLGTPGGTIFCKHVGARRTQFMFGNRKGRRICGTVFGPAGELREGPPGGTKNATPEGPKTVPKITHCGVGFFGCPWGGFVETRGLSARFGRDAGASRGRWGRRTEAGGLAN